MSEVVGFQVLRVMGGIEYKTVNAVVLKFSFMSTWLTKRTQSINISVGCFLSVKDSKISLFD